VVSKVIFESSTLGPLVALKHEKIHAMAMIINFVMPLRFIYWEASQDLVTSLQMLWFGSTSCK